LNTSRAQDGEDLRESRTATALGTKSACPKAPLIRRKESSSRTRFEAEAVETAKNTIGRGEKGNLSSFIASFSRSICNDAKLCTCN